MTGPLRNLTGKGCNPRRVLRPHPFETAGRFRMVSGHPTVRAAEHRGFDQLNKSSVRSLHVALLRGAT